MNYEQLELNLKIQGFFSYRKKTVWGTTISLVNILPLIMRDVILTMNSYKLTAATFLVLALRYKMATGKKGLTIFDDLEGLNAAVLTSAGIISC